MPVAQAFVQQGIHVICDKPVATSLAEAQTLAQAVLERGLLFLLTHTYAGYPMVRQARELVAAGELGELRIVQVEYAQDWLGEPVEQQGNKQAEWRADPKRAGPAGALGDIGTHAYQLACYVSGLTVQELSAELSTFVPGRALDDHVQAMLRFEGGARGMLWASQVARGACNALRLRLYGTRASLHFDQEQPEQLWFAPLGEPARMLRRAMPPQSAAQASASRIPAGHPEGYFEAFAELYRDFARAWRGGPKPRHARVCRTVWRAWPSSKPCSAATNRIRAGSGCGHPCHSACACIRQQCQIDMPRRRKAGAERRQWSDRSHGACRHPGFFLDFFCRPPALRGLALDAAANSFPARRLVASAVSRHATPRRWRRPGSLRTLPCRRCSHWASDRSSRVRSCAGRLMDPPASVPCTAGWRWSLAAQISGHVNCPPRGTTSRRLYDHCLS